MRKERTQMSDSRDRMIATASSLFLGGSYHKVGIAEICDVAQVNKGTFYHFFPSKIDLLLVVLDRYAAAVAEEIDKVAASSQSPAQKVRSIFNVLQSHNEEWQAVHGAASGCFLGNIILEMAATDPLVRERAKEAIDHLTERLQPIVREYIVSEGASTKNTPAVAELLKGLIQGCQVQTKVYNDPMVFQRYAAGAPAMLLAACAVDDIYSERPVTVQ